jgi:restriction system protein
VRDFPDPEALYREAVRLYRVWKSTQGEDIQPSDPGLDTSVIAVTGPADDAIAEKSVGVTFEEAEEQAWGEIEQHLRSMNPFDFQDMVADLLKAMGYHVFWVAPAGKDGGVDIIATPDPLGTRPPRIKVPVKRVTDRVDTDTIKSFVAVLDDEDVGIFVSTGGFTRSADEFARHQARRRVTLVDLERLLGLWIEFYARLDDFARRRLPLTPIYFLTPKT